MEQALAGRDDLPPRAFVFLGLGEQGVLALSGDSRCRSEEIRFVVTSGSV